MHIGVACIFFFCLKCVIPHSILFVLFATPVCYDRYIAHSILTSTSTGAFTLNHDGSFKVSNCVLNDFDRDGYIVVKGMLRLFCHHCHRNKKLQPYFHTVNNLLHTMITSLK